MKLSLALAAYVASKQSLGMRFATEARTLKAYCRSIGDIDVANVEAQRVRAFLDGSGGPVTRYWHRKLDALRGFYQFAQARGYVTSAPLPSVSSVPQMPPRFVPYIYSYQEVKRLLETTKSREHRNLTVLTCRTLLLLLYGTGLRISEALGLDMTDVDLGDGILHVRDTKFYKTRLVPIGPDLTRVLTVYAAQRSAHLLGVADTPFLITRSNRRISRATAEEYFKHLRVAAGIHRDDGARYQPRLHDMRHTFATTRLIRWYRDGADVQRLLPQLATYLGHVHIGGTQNYLSLTPELLRYASERFELYAIGGNDHA
jgi:site-specific recombinase XerD